METNEVNEDFLGKALFLELARLIVTIVIDIVCTACVWNGTLEPGYATAAIITKDWITELALEEEDDATSLFSDMLRDIHCFCDVIACVALSIYEAQQSINPNIQLGSGAKVAIAVGCALHFPIWICLLSTSLHGSLKQGLIGIHGIFSTFIFCLLQLAAWALAVSVAGGANSVELAFVSVALNKVAVFISKAPKDEAPIRWFKGLIFAITTAVQVVLMNSKLEEPSNTDECVEKCPLAFCQIGVSVISRIVPTVAAQNGTHTRNSSWPSKTTLPTERISGWLILDKENVCAHELMLTGSQKGLFTAWTVITSFSGLLILFMIMYKFVETLDKEVRNSRSDQSPVPAVHGETAFRT